MILQKQFLQAVENALAYLVGCISNLLHTFLASGEGLRERLHKKRKFEMRPPSGDGFICKYINYEI
jgi:hypothetical protein